ncbi:T-complex protein 1 subunit theta-like 2 [Molossus molossus]|uniref:Chaperonin containing TCP1 subunit 8 like 2 n=1 Tax=Molossus molossus TaxID=27622 RepID=A0A7J8HAN7_MOLMO|nr:T-complex protein 1 subunit theta-like 2 [Molossus molossus]KAF6469101.1 chaperonin containing TCP1 subunit 8 like 2 [Molossus molossus]
MDSGAPSPQELPQRLWPGPSGSAAEEKHLLSSLAAAHTLARIIRPCYGPHGLQKLLVTAKGETVFTGYATAILGALDLEHPAARLLRDAALSQAQHSGDGVAFVVLLAEALLAQAERLLQAGLPRAQLREAYAAATAETLALLPLLAVRSLGPLEDPFWALHSVMNTHTLSHAEYLTKLVAQACWSAKELDGTFRPEQVGVCVVQGGQLEDSCLLPGLAVRGTPRGQVTMVQRGARVALFDCAFGPACPKAPSKARLSSPTDLLRFRTGSDILIERQVAQLAAAGVNVAVVRGDIEEKSLSQADKYGIMVIEVKSLRELVFLSEVLGTPLMPHLVAPQEPGKCQQVYPQELGEGLAVVFQWEPAGTPALTLVLRGATKEGLRGAEQAVYHGIDAFSQLCQDPRLLPGAGAAEMALAKLLADKGSALEGPTGPALLAFAQALRSLPAALAENAGLAVSAGMADMTASHQAGHCLAGVGPEGVINVAQEGVWDALATKARGLRTAAEVVLQLATVDEIVLAKDSPARQQDSDPHPRRAKDRASPVGRNK